MSVTNTLFTTNSYRIDIVNEIGNGSTNIINGVNAALTTLGWSLYDTINAAGFNPVTTKVYRVLNADGVTYKYLIIRWDTVKLFFYTSTCETWNTIGKLPINESWSAAGGFAQGYDLVLSSIIVSATTRHVMLWNSINNYPGPWTSVMEFERVAQEDTVVAPGGSISFNGTSDFLTVPASSKMDLSGATFTIEAWILPTGFLSGGVAPVIIAQDDGSTTGTFSLVLTAGTGDLTWTSYLTSPRTGALAVTSNNTRVILNQWNHVAASYDGQFIRLFINGVLAGISALTPFASAMYSSSSIATGIGHWNSTGVATGYFPGYITNVKITKGQCLYTNTFLLSTPPSYYVPLTAGSNTQLLLKVSDAGTYLTDSSSNAFTVTAAGGAPAYNAATPLSGGVPCYAWTNSLMLGTPNSALSSLNAMGYTCQFAPPRTILGATGAVASSEYTSVTNRGFMPPILVGNYSVNGVTSVVANDGNYGMLASYANVLIPYGWDTTKSPVSPISVVQGSINSSSFFTVPSPANQSTAGFGRIYNVSIGRGLGNIRVPDTSYANLDATNGWVSSTGANTAALLLPLNGGLETYLTVPANANRYDPTTFSNTFANIGPSVFPGKTVVVGDTIFVSANSVSAAATTGSGIFTVSQAAGNFSTPTFRANIPFGVFDMVFDGNGSIWGTTANGVMRMNPTTFSTTFYANTALTTNGAGYMGIDGTNLYLSTRISNTKPQIIVFNYKTQTFTNQIDTNAALTVASTWGTPVPDYAGNVFIFQTAGTNIATSMLMQKNNSAGTIFGTVASTLGPGNGAINWGLSGYYDFITGRLWHLAGHGGVGTFYIQELFTANMTQTGGINALNTTSAFNAYFQGALAPNSVTDYKGDLSIIPFRGYHLISVKRPGIVQYTTGNCTSAIARFISFDAGPSAGTYSYYNQGAIKQVGTNPSNTISSMPVSGSAWTTTNGVQLFGAWGPVNTIDTRVYTVNGIYTANTTVGANVGRLIMKG